ncbi:MAG: endonuclease [Flavobacteriaceae bacterium]
MADFTEPEMGIAFEKQIKKWSLAKKKALIDGKLDYLVQLAKKKFK